MHAASHVNAYSQSQNIYASLGLGKLPKIWAGAPGHPERMLEHTCASSQVRQGNQSSLPLCNNKELLTEAAWPQKGYYSAWALLSESLEVATTKYSSDMAHDTLMQKETVGVHRIWLYVAGALLVTSTRQCCHGMYSDASAPYATLPSLLSSK